MIINFSVENFGSIKEKQTLSFLANKSDHLEDYYVIEPIKGLRLNKLALIYGANASGKTTVLKALDFLRKICTEPFDKKTEKFDFEPFLFDENTPQQNTKFELEFVQNEGRYFYEVELNKNCIVKERLYNFSPNKALVFERTTDEERELTSIKFGRKILKRKHLEESLEIFTLWNNTVLGGYIKTNIDDSNLFFFLYEFRSITPLVDKSRIDYFTNNLVYNGEIDRKDIKNFLKKADFNIDDFNVEIENEDVKNKINKYSVKFRHSLNGQNYELPFDSESEGTQRYYVFSTFLILLIKDDIILSIDELESSLHPDLYRHFLLTFLVNSKKSQLIATTHNREILNNRDLFRDDAIWFTDKNEDSATELYSLADFDSSVVRDTSNVLNAYKSGKLGGVPNLGDYYIDLEDGE
ncbi:ATP/GTP-binding protein [Chryseobacterium taeanense]|uniref:AAA family ATPase n=1 Tax=Chryseobacterium taeanense TaxID=311334 RepID=UPI0035B18BA0